MSADMKPPPTVTQTITLRNKDKSKNGNGGTNTAINNRNYKEHSTGYNSSNIKSSFSMTSLPPNEVQDGSAKAKLTMERPYNSLKKKRNSDGDSWRHSWGSGQSHSSCSLHSNATGVTGLGKDEFWAALQSNYNYIMDTNLLDTCREARGEIEGASNIVGNAPECCRSQLKHHEEERDKNPRALRKWLREMEHKLSNTPSLHQATKLSCSELQERLAQHSVLYYEIVSHARVVGACIKAFDKENNCSNDNSFNSLSSEDCPPTKGITANENNIITITTSPNANNIKKCDGSLKALERRYHLLYLKAIEVQCLFEGLLKRKDCTGILSEQPTSNEESESTDNEPVSKLAKLSNFDQSGGPTAFELFGFTNTNQDKEIINQDNTLVPDDDKNYSINQYNENINDTVVDEVDNSHQKEINNWQKQNFNKLIDNFYNTYSDFDADSEGSDYDVLNKNLKYRQKRYNCGNNKNKCNLQKGLQISNTIIKDYNVFNISEIMDTSSNNIITTTTTSSISTSLPLLQKNSVVNEKLSLSSENKLNIVTNQSLNRSSKSIIDNSINNNNNNSGNFENSSSPSSPILRVSTPISTVNKKQQQRRNFDVSKFNRSNRKSKNCAIFYFKHLDTDNETNFGISSQGSETIQSVDDGEIDEEEDDDDDWMYTSNEHLESKSVNEITLANDNSSLVGNLLSDDSDKENKKIILIEQKSNNMDRNYKDSNGNIQLQENDRPSAALIRSPSIIQNCIKQSQKNIDPLEIKSNNDTIPIEEISQIATTEITATAVKTNAAATISDEMPPKTNKEEICHDSIKQLVLDAENLVRDEILKTPKKKITQSGGMKTSTTVKKREIMLPGHNIQRVHEWLEHQPLSPKKCTVESKSIPTTDCEASGEYTESDSAPARETDSSDGFTDSIATCMQTGGSTSQCTSTEIIGDMSGEQSQMPYIGSNPSLSSGKVIRRIPNRRNSERPWSVSCLSQLTEINVGDSNGVGCNQIKASPTKNILASHSISESAINILSSPLRKQSHQTSVKNSDSKGSLKRRKTRKKTKNGRKTDSGSEKLNNYDLPTLTQSLMNSETISSEQITIIQDLAAALSMLSLPQQQKNKSEMESEEEFQQQQQLMKPNFKVGGTYTKSNLNDSKLGSLAALANYRNEDGDGQTGTDDHNSSFSEQAWDNYQEKYNSENYSEGFDSDAARRLMEFGDDYRNFLDSQSDCCSSLSAANNLDSLSPPRMDSLQQSEVKFTQETIASTVDHARRRRALEIEYERRRKTLEMKRKASQELIQQNANLSPTPNSVKVNSTSLTPKSNDINRSLNRNAIDSVSRKLDFSSSNNCVKRSSESETSIRRRKQGDGEQSGVRRRCTQSYKGIPSTSSSSNEGSEDEAEINNMLLQSRNRLENTNALKIRTHLLRPEDYTEIINTCRDNITCLDAVLRGPSRTALSSNQSTEIRDLLSNWEILLGWSENAGAARKMQEEMIILKNSINRLGCKISTNMESVESIQFVIDELKNEKIELQKYRTNMLRLNASVHTWLTRHENKLHKELEALQVIDDNNDDDNNNDGDGNKQNESGGVESNLCEKSLQINSIVHSESEFYKHLKNEVSEMYRSWEDADSRINHQLDVLTASLIAWRQLDFGLSEFYQVLGNDRGTLEGLEGALEKNPTKSMELSHNVKLVAKLLSEKIEATQQLQQTVGSHSTIKQEENNLDVEKFIHITRIAASNGSLSDSGISDGGTTSDGGLSERERRLGVLRRLAKQLETALSPGSEALQSITARMEAAEAELKTLQNTCRDLIVRTAISQQTKLTESTNNKIAVNSDLAAKSQNHSKKKNSPQLTKRKNKRRNNLIAKTANETNTVVAASNRSSPKGKISKFTNNDELDYGNNAKNKSSSWDIDDSDKIDIEPQRSWSWRVARIAVPMQLALFTIFCAACLMEPHCCSSINNLAMSFTPQLRYIRGPPPI